MSKGFSRITSITSVERKIKIFSNKLTITDSFTGGKKHEVKTYFHWDSKVMIEPLKNNCWQVSIDDLYGYFQMYIDAPSDVKILYGDKSPLGWMSYNYGDSKPAPTMEIITELKFPNDMQYSFKWMK